MPAGGPPAVRNDSDESVEEGGRGRPGEYVTFGPLSARRGRSCRPWGREGDRTTKKPQRKWRDFFHLSLQTGLEEGGPPPSSQSPPPLSQIFFPKLNHEATAAARREENFCGKRAALNIQFCFADGPFPPSLSPLLIELRARWGHGPVSVLFQRRRLYFSPKNTEISHKE